MAEKRRETWRSRVMEPRYRTGRRSTGTTTPPLRGFPYGRSQKPQPSRPARGRPSIQTRPFSTRPAAAGSKQPRRGLAGLSAMGRQRPAPSPFAKASARLAPRRQTKQSGGRAAAAANLARGLMSQGSARNSKKGPAALAMAAAGAVGGVALARRRKAGVAPETETATDTTLHVSSEPVQAAGTPPAGREAPPSPAAG